MTGDHRITACRLVHVPRDAAIPYQIHAIEPWTDNITGKPTSYLAGFPTPEARARWVEIAGYRPVEEEAKR